MNLGKNLSAIRESRNETVDSVAKALKVLPGVIISIEKGHRDFKVKELFNLCDHYGTDVETVVKDSGMIQIRLV